MCLNGVNNKADLVFKILIVGDMSVGKTNLLANYLNNTFNENTKTTIGIEFGNKIIKYDDKVIKIQCWDTAGEERYKSITSAYYKGASGAFVVYDITKASSFNSIDYWISDLKKYCENIIVVLIGNKCDLEKERKISENKGISKAKEYNIKFFEVSSKLGKNVNEAFSCMTSNIYSQLKMNKKENKEIGFFVTEENEEIEDFEIEGIEENEECCIVI